MSRDLDEDSDDSLPPFSVLMGSTKVMRPPSQSSSLAGSNLSSLDEISISNGEEMELDVTIPIRIRNHSLSSLSDTEDSLRGRMSRLSHETGENPPVTSLLQKGEVAAERVKRQCQQTIMESFDGENLFTNDNCKQINLMEMRRNFVIALSKLKQPQKGFRKIIDRIKSNEVLMSAIQGSFDDWSSNENISDRTLLAGLLASLMSLSVDIESFIPTVYNDSEGLVLSLEPFLENQVDVNGTTSIESAKFHSMIAEALKLWLKIAMKTMDQVCWEPENLALLFFMFCRVSLHRMDQSEYSRIDNVFGGLSACVKTASTKEVQFQQFEEFVLKFLPDVSSNVQSLYRVAEIVLMGLEDRNRLLTRGTSEVEWTIKFVAKIQLLIAGEILEIPESNSLTIDVKIDGAQRLWDKIAKISENDNQDFNRIFTSVNLLKQYMECLYCLHLPIDTNEGARLMESFDSGIFLFRQSRSVDAMKIQHVLFLMRERLKSQLKDSSQMFSD